MLRCRSFAALWLSLAVSISTLRADENDKVPAEKILPAKTLLMVSIPSVPELQNRFEESIWMKMWNDPELKGIVTEAEKQWKEVTDPLEQDLGLKTGDVWGVFKGELSLFASRVARGKLATGFLIEVDDESEALAKLLEVAQDKLEQDGYVHETRQVDETQIVGYTKGELQFNWFRRDGYFVAATDDRMLEAILMRWDGQNSDVLAERDEYRYIMNRCWKQESEPALRWFIDPVGFARLSIESQDSAIQQASYTTILSQLGFESFKAVGGTLDLATEKYEMVNEILFCVDSPLKGALQFLRGDAISQPVPKWVHADAGYCLSINWDVQGAWNAAKAMVDEFQGPGVFDRMIDEIAENEQGPRIHPKKDVVDNLTGRIVFEASPPSGTDELSDDRFIVGIGIKSPDVMSDVFSRLEALEGSSLESRSFLGHTIYESRGNFSEPLAFTVAGGMLFMSINPARIEEIIRDSDGAEKLADSTVYDRLRAEAPEAVSVWGIERLGKQIGSMLEHLQVIGGLLRDDLSADEFDPSQLPDAKVFEKYPLDRWFHIIPDERGAYWKDYILRK